MAKLEKIYHYLKSQDKIKSGSLEEFAAALQKPGIVDKVFSHLKSQGVIKTSDIIEFKSAFGLAGGVDPTKRVLPKDVVVKYREHIRNKDIQPLVDIEETDPIIYDKKEFMDFYKQKALAKLSPEDLAFYNNAEPENRDSFLALRGGLPDFEQYQKVVRDYEQPATTTGHLPSGGTSGYKPQGYRYSEGKPARESITKRSR